MLTQDRLTNPKEGIRYPDPKPVAAATHIYSGAMVGIETAAGANQGYALPATASPSLTIIGTAHGDAPNANGAAGDVQVEIDAFPQHMKNSGGADEIFMQHVGQLCYAVNDETVALTDGEGTRPVAGKVAHVSTFGVLVDFIGAANNGAVGTGPGVAPSATKQITDADLTAAALTQTFTLLASPPAGLYLLYGRVDETFTGGGATTVTIDAGINTTNPDLLADAVNVFAATFGYGPLVGDAGPVAVTVPDGANDLEIIVTSDVNVNLLTTGDGTFNLFRIG